MFCFSSSGTQGKGILAISACKRFRKLRFKAIWGFACSINILLFAHDLRPALLSACVVPGHP